jgi:vacuolar protein 8
MESTSPEVQLRSAGLLRNLASDEKYQLDIVRNRGLLPLLRLLKSGHPPLILSAITCIRNISVHPSNKSPIIEAGFLSPLVEFFTFSEVEEIQCYAISTIRNLAVDADLDTNKELMLQAGVVSKCVELILKASQPVQLEMIAVIQIFTLGDELNPTLLDPGVFDVLITLTESDNVEIQGRATAAFGNISSKGEFPVIFIWMYERRLCEVSNYDIFIDKWAEPHSGLYGFLHRLLDSGNLTFQYVATRTLVQLLESEDKRLLEKISQTDDIVVMVKALANRAVTIDREGDEEGNEEGEREVVRHARRCASLLGTDEETTKI